MTEQSHEDPEVEKAARTYIERLNAFGSGQSHACPLCGEEVMSVSLYAKTEPAMFSLYVYPCRHRLGLWSKAPEWIKDVQIIPLKDYEDD